MTHQSVRLRFVLGILALALVSGAAQNAKTTAPDVAIQAELEHLEKAWNEAHLAGDAATLDSLWADELVVTVPRMPLFSKAQSLSIWRTGKMKFKRYETSGLAYRILGDTAVVTGALIRERTFNGKEIREDWRFTKVYVRRDSKWKVVAWHASEAAPS